jgi:hypothetical protein
MGARRTWAGRKSGARWRDQDAESWFDRLFQSAPDLITLLLPQGASAVLALAPDAPANVHYRYGHPNCWCYQVWLPHRASSSQPDACSNFESARDDPGECQGSVHSVQAGNSANC